MLSVVSCTSHHQLVRSSAWKLPAVKHTVHVLHAHAARGLPQRLNHLRSSHIANATESTGAPVPDPEEDSDSELGVLLPEEDWEVPGTYEDAMRAGTKLGKAVAGACDELANLGSLENEVLSQAQEVLQRAGFKGSLFRAQAQAPSEDAAAESSTSAP